MKRTQQSKAAKAAAKRPARRSQLRSEAAPERPSPVNADEPVDGRHARRARTEARLFEALAVILRDGGVAALGVNAVAARSGVDKVLIYRYFGGIEGMMEEYAKRSDFWPTTTEILGGDDALLHEPDRARAGAELLCNYARALRRRPVTLDLLAWECAHRNPLTIALESVREARALELFQQLSAAGFPLQGGVAELSVLLSAAINYLALRSRSIKVFSGLPVGDDAAWAQMEKIFTLAFRGVLAAAEGGVSG